ncbi:MAG: GGDEF domain-containing protein [Candidatus Thiodiazotropha sp. (ex Codakia rugifera)]|nr:GGDEF domain-containing protein [Candidatus Thiodiazotropha sp. (ex Codakia rugifera)]
MTDKNQNELNDPMVKYTETPQQAGELFRLAVAFLAKHKLAIHPVNYGLAYHYVAGSDAALNGRMDELLIPGEWSDRVAFKLFRQYISHCDEAMLRDLREELLNIVAHTLGTMIDLTGKTSVTNQHIEKQINTLAESTKVESVMKAVSSILAETHSLVMDTSKFEAQLISSTEEMEKLKEELDYARQEARRDPLTGILNRRGFDQSLETMIAEAEEQHLATFSLMLMDIDLFKEINDTHGHLLGDKLLQGVANLLTHHTKGKDACARFGGDEFAILLPETGVDNAKNLAESLRIIIQKIVLKRPNQGAVIGGITVSVGVSAYRLGESSEDFIQRCDKALYRSKALGRNRVTIAG